MEQITKANEQMTVEQFFNTNKGEEGFVDFDTMVEFSESQSLYWIMDNDRPDLSLEEKNITIYLDGDIYKEFKNDTPMTDVISYIRKILLERLKNNPQVYKAFTNYMEE